MGAQNSTVKRAADKRRLKDFTSKSLLEALKLSGFQQFNSPSRYMSAYLYEDIAKIYHNKEGDFAAIFRLEPYDGNILNDGHIKSLRAFLRGVCVSLNTSCTGSYTRFTLPDISQYLDHYANGNLESNNYFKNECGTDEWWGKNSIADDIEESMVARYRDASKSPTGFMSDVDNNDFANAIASYAKEIKDDKLAEIILQNTKSATSINLRPVTHEHWFVLKWTPSFMLGKNINDLGNILKIAAGISTEDEIQQQSYGRHVSDFVKCTNTVKTALTNARLYPRIVEVNEYVDVFMELLNPHRKDPQPSKNSPVFTQVDNQDQSTESETYSRDVSIGDVIIGAKTLPYEDISQNIAFSPMKASPKGLDIFQPNRKPFHYRVVSLLHRLAKNRPGMIHDPIDNYNFNGWTTVNFHPVTNYVTKARLALRRNIMNGRMLAKKKKDRPITDADMKESEGIQYIDEAIDSPIADERDKQFDVSVHTVIGSEDRLAVEGAAEQLAADFFGKGVVEQLRGEAAIYASLPLNYFEEQSTLLRRHHSYMSEAVANFFPVFTHFKGIDRSGILFANRYGSPVFIDQFTDKSKTGHTLIVGTTGTGKSFVTNYILASVICKYNPLIRIFDKGGSYKDLCLNLGGDYVELSRDQYKSSLTGEMVNPSCQNPMHLELDPLKGKLHSPSNEDINSIAFQLIEMRAALVKKLDSQDDFGVKQLTTLVKALRAFFEFWTEENTISPILSDFAKYLESYSLGDIKGKDIALDFALFYGDGTYARMFDGQSSFSWKNPFVVVETNRLAGDPLLPAILVNLLRQISNDIIFNTPLLRKKIIAIDEAWSVLASPSGAATLADFFRTLRKNNCGVLLISQLLKDFAKIVAAEGSDNGDDGIMANTTHFYFLPTDPSDYAVAQKELGFTDQAIRMWNSLSGAPPFYSEIFYSMKDSKQDWQHGIIRYVSSPFIYWMSSSDPNDGSYRDKLTKEFKTQGLTGEDARKASIKHAAKVYPFGKRFGMSKEYRDSEEYSEQAA